ncbi:MAG: asparagine synthase-related protein [Candidatus Bathyarchaeia archaeon]
MAPVGVNAIDGDRIDGAEMEEEVLVIEDEGLVVNINTLDDLRAAEERLGKGRDLEGSNGHNGLPSLNETCLRLTALLEEAVRRNLADGILLSGGLDTSILAAIASKLASLKAYTARSAGGIGTRRGVRLSDGWETGVKALNPCLR